ncbi:carbohydrate kinase [Microbacterium sp. SORGH_AS_0888]|uniref:carbohydrate kinase family protein n=1 Tax=Microbacterium sp. SORGH_AS_0888 TaxID=3041791 RepID=UPI00277DBF98|nr:carbohydrate kinase [Microbacterium sp. SORGH_AS_0888]MDQ1130565.1 fructokinase [Microbacterium sp. SORGH_AS_0888]
MTGPRGLERVLVIGEALVDVVERDGVREVHPGGSPMNVAYGLGRLGLPVVFATEFADDAYGALIADHLRAGGVQVIRGAVPASTSVAAASLGADGAASYEFDLEWGFALDALPPAALVHVGSIGALREPGGSRVRDLLEGMPPGTLVTFDPNVRPALVPPPDRSRELVAWYSARADVVKLSDEDAAWLAPGRSEDEVLEWLLDAGAGLAVMTLGSRGSLLRSRRGRVEMPARPTTVVDTIGAGDAYMTGLIAAIGDLDASGDVRAGADAALLEALGGVASATAALTVARPGAAPPTRDELRAARDADSAR